MKQFTERSLPFFLVLALTACGGDSTTDAENPDDETTTGFTGAAEWQFVAPVSGDKTECFDFDTNQIMACENSTDWDLKIVHGSGGRATPSFYTNSGVSGSGNGAALGSPFDYTWAELSAFRSGTVDDSGAAVPAQAFSTDKAANAFSDAVFVYGSDHRMSPTYRVFIVTTDRQQLLHNITEADTAFAVQITDYYGGDTGATSGYVSIRWVDVTNSEAEPRTLEVNATSYTAWTHVDLINGTVVDAPADNNWHLAFQRYSVKSNSGISGAGSIGSFKGTAVAEDANAEAVLAALQSADGRWGWVSDLTRGNSAWSVDTASSTLNPAYQGTYPNPLDFGFYLYHPTANDIVPVAHMLSPADTHGVMLRSGEGNSYARVRMTAVTYADAADYNSQRTYRLQFDVQPAL